MLRAPFQSRVSDWEVNYEITCKYLLHQLFVFVAALLLFRIWDYFHDTFVHQGTNNMSSHL